MGARARAAPAVLLGAAAGLALSGILTTLLTAAPFPPLVLADALVRIAPGSVATGAIEALGHRALPLAVIASTALFLAASALLGWLTVSLRRRPGRDGSAALAVATFAHGLPYLAIAAIVLSWSASSDPPWSAVLLVPPFGLAVVVTGLRGRSPARAHRFDPWPPSRSRRDLLGGLGLAVFSLAVGWIGSVGLPSRGSRSRVGVSELDLGALPTIGPGAGPFDLPGLSPELTPTDEHYVVDTSIVDPVIDEDDWVLSIGGSVERPLTLSYADLLRLPRVEQVVTMECVSNEVGGDLISTARWGGVRLRDLLIRAGLRDDVIEVVSRAVGGYSDSIRVERAMLDTTLIALEMNGERLPRQHGFPARLLVPGLYGYKQPKWLEQITVVGAPHRGYWETRGWAKDGTVKTMSRIDTVAADGDDLIVAGIAFAGDRGIRRVEVTTDDGRSWLYAEIRDPLSPLSWRLWRSPLGKRRPERLVVRATDGFGRVQTRTMSRPHPDGATGWHSVALV